MDKEMVARAISAHENFITQLRRIGGGTNE